ncbi:MAG: glycosyltransferase family 39 protein [Candidatus Eisenbacteria bacterium]
MLRINETPAPRRRAAAAAKSPPGPWLAVFLVALALRVGYVWMAAGPGAVPSSDPLEYDTVAWNLARGAGFALGTGSDSYPTAFVPPVVPWITSLLYRVVGHQFFAALLLQCVIGALVPLLLASLASATFGGSVARIAAWLAALHPLLVFFSGYLLTETTFTAALLAALVASAAWLKTPRPGRALGVGLLWGLACLTRPTALALPALIGVWAWRPLGLTIAPSDRFRQLALLALGVALVVGPWTLRNGAALGAFIPVTTGGGRAFLDSNNPVVWGNPVTRGGANSTYSIEPWAGMFRGRSEPQVDAIARAEGVKFLGGHVSEWPAMALAKLGRFWRLSAEGGGTGHWQREGSPLIALARSVDPLMVWSLVVLPFAVFGWIRSLAGARRWFLSLPALVILYFMGLAVLFWGSLRMRVPIEPLVLLYAAAGADEARRRWWKRARGFRVIEGRG